MNKHDAGCLQRKSESGQIYLCTCDESPPAAKLTKAQLRTLELIRDTEAEGKRQWRAYGSGGHQVARRLHRMGLIEPGRGFNETWTPEYVLTDSGRAALMLNSGPLASIQTSP